MFTILLASLLSLSSLKMVSKMDNPSQVQVIAMTDQDVHIHYSSDLEVKKLSSQITYYLSKDVKGDFENYKGTHHLISGDILVFGSSAEDIETVGVYQGDDQFLHITAHGKVAAITISNLSEEKWNANFLYRGYYRPNQSFTNVKTDYSNPISWEELFLGQFLNSQKFPYVLTPRKSSFSLETYSTWAQTRQWQMQSLLNQHGALLLRNFPIHNAEDFKTAFSTTVALTPIDYLGGDASRKKIIQGVYTSTEAPSEFNIPLHHELSCTNAPASYISFYCDIAPIKGTGQTLLGRTETISQELHKRPKVWDFFEGKNIKYISRHPPVGNFFTKVNPTHKNWVEAFESTDKKEVEKICKALGFEYEWQGEWLQVTRIAPAIRPPDQHFPFSYWYNQIHLYHANPRLRGGFFKHFLANLLYIDPSTRQYDVTLEDGNTIDQDIVYEIYDVLEANAVKFDWQKGDVLILDNRRSLHGRAATSGERRILASMTYD